MCVVYLRHPRHGEKVAFTEAEVQHDKEHGWEEFDPTNRAPQVPDFLAPVCDLPDTLPGREALIKGGILLWSDLVTKSADDLKAIDGIGNKTADAILKVIEG